MKEFKKGLRALDYPNEKSWNSRMIRRLFSYCDKNSDGYLSILEFNDFIFDHDKTMLQPIVEKLTLSGNLLNLSDDEDDFFQKRNASTDHELMKKVNFASYKKLSFFILLNNLPLTIIN